MVGDDIYGVYKVCWLDDIFLLKWTVNPECVFNLWLRAPYE